MNPPESGPILFVLTGLPASGKSSVAGRLQSLTAAEWLSTDRARERLFPLGEVGAERKYSSEASAAVYAHVESRAEDALRGGRAAIIDGTYLEPVHRARPIAMAERLKCPILMIEVWAPEPVIRARLAEREPGRDAASEADLAVYEEMKRRVDDPGEDAAGLADAPPTFANGQPVSWVRVDTSSGAIDAHLADGNRTLEVLVQSLWEP